MVEETTQTPMSQVPCEGSALQGHPRVYLDLTKKGEAICPYCSRRFILSHQED